MSTKLVLVFRDQTLAQKSLYFNNPKSDLTLANIQSAAAVITSSSVITPSNNAVWNIFDRGYYETVTQTDITE